MKSMLGNKYRVYIYVYFKIHFTVSFDVKDNRYIKNNYVSVLCRD